jgi:hypothetical protein
VDQYRLPGLAKHDVNQAAETAFFNMLDKHGVDMQVTVGSGTPAFGYVPRPGDLSSYVEERKKEEKVNGPTETRKRVAVIARYVFKGKGAPEHCQIVLQLVAHWGLAPKGLQAYADSALGLDCNGFVGNYLWHGKNSVGWSYLAVGKHEVGPDASIDGFFDKRKAVRKLEEMDTSKSYILGKVGPTGLVIPGGKSVATAGHIIVTEPGRFQPAMRGTNPRIYAVECTASHDPGLCETWYSILSVDAKGIFTIFRESMTSHQFVKFKVAPL